MQVAEGSAPKKDWTNIIFLTLTPIIGIPGTIWYTWKNGFELWMLVLFLVMYSLVVVSIGAGYHRFFSHKSYECSPVVQVFYAFFGAMTAQNSILWWSSGHRQHHTYVDKDWDPYNIKRGFWWAHILWVFYRAGKDQTLDNVRDLEKNPVVRWQKRWHFFILMVPGFGIPAAVGYLFGDAIAGLLWGGFLRLVLMQHATFLVNSLAHTLGSPEYNLEVSARDNWLVALITFGEGYHSFHHRFPSDFRNGIRWYHFDPTKWFIATLKLVGLASDLRTAPPAKIEQARFQTAMKRLETRIESAPSKLGDQIRQRITAARESFDHSFELWRQHSEERARGLSTAWRSTRRKSRLRLKQARQEWREALRILAQVRETA